MRMEEKERKILSDHENVLTVEQDCIGKGNTLCVQWNKKLLFFLFTLSLCLSLSILPPIHRHQNLKRRKLKIRKCRISGLIYGFNLRVNLEGQIEGRKRCIKNGTSSLSFFFLPSSLSFFLSSFFLLLFLSFFFFLSSSFFLLLSFFFFLSSSFFLLLSFFFFLSSSFFLPFSKSIFQ